MVICAGNCTDVYEEVLQLQPTIINVLEVFNSDENGIKRFQINQPANTNQIFQYFQNIQSIVKNPIDSFCFNLNLNHIYGNVFRKEFIDASKRHGIKNVRIIGHTKSLLIQALSLFSHPLQSGDAFWIIFHDVGKMFCDIWKFDEKDGWKFQAHYNHEKTRFHRDPYRKQSILTEDLQKLKAKIGEIGIVPFLFVFTSVAIAESSEQKFKKVFLCKNIIFYRYKTNKQPLNASLKYACCLSGDRGYAKYRSDEVFEKLIEVVANDKVIIKVVPFSVLPFKETAVINSAECKNLKILVNNEHGGSIAVEDQGNCEVVLTVDINSIDDININPCEEKKHFAIPSDSNSKIFGNTTLPAEDEPLLKPAGLLNFDIVETNSATLSNIYIEGEVYRNFSSPKGLALIINNRIFVNPDKERHGTEFDEINLRKLLSGLGYTVETKHDLSGEAMLREAESFAYQEAHKFCDSCVVVVLTHGNTDVLGGTDEANIDIHKFFECFNSKRAPLLKGKPKLFFIQSCRGPKVDLGIDSTDAGNLAELFCFLRAGTPRLPEQAEPAFSTPLQPPVLAEPNYPNLPEYMLKIKNKKQPIEADMLIAFATPRQYLSFREAGYGSWFIQSICEIFSEDSAKEDICSLLTRVNRRVAQAYQKYEHGGKQMPEFVNRLQKRFYFFPGINKWPRRHVT